MAEALAISSAKNKFAQHKLPHHQSIATTRAPVTTSTQPNSCVVAQSEVFLRKPDFHRSWLAHSVVGYRWGVVTPSTQVEVAATNSMGETTMSALRRFWNDEQGQDIAEYAVMLAVILVIVIGTVRLIGTNANTVFSQVASSVQ